VAPVKPINIGAPGSAARPTFSTLAADSPEREYYDDDSPPINVGSRRGKRDRAAASEEDDEYDPLTKPHKTPRQVSICLLSCTEKMTHRS
jgi:hypothetical protein